MTYPKNILPTDLYQKLLQVCFPSKEMVAYLEKHLVSRQTAIEIVLKAPISLEIKAALLDEIALTDEPTETVSEELGDEEKQISNRLYRKVLLESRTAAEHANAIRRALDALKLKPGEILCKREHWFDEDILEEKYGEGVLFQTMEAAADYMQRELEYELDGEELNADKYMGWTELDKWVPGGNGRMENPYTFFLIFDEVVYFTDNRLWNDDLDWLPESHLYAGGNFDLNLPIPFQPGVIVSLDCRPFAPPKPVVLLEVDDDCCGVQMLYLGVDGFWHTAALKHHHGWDDGNDSYYPMSSPLYRLAINKEKLEPEYELLKKVSKLIAGSESRGRALWKAIHNTPSERVRGGLTVEELVPLLSQMNGDRES